VKKFAEKWSSLTGIIWEIIFPGTLTFLWWDIQLKKIEPRSEGKAYSLNAREIAPASVVAQDYAKDRSPIEKGTLKIFWFCRAIKYHGLSEGGGP
jgi:hypothetical protein